MSQETAPEAGRRVLVGPGRGGTGGPHRCCPSVTCWTRWGWQKGGTQTGAPSFGPPSLKAWRDEERREQLCCPVHCLVAGGARRGFGRWLAAAASGPRGGRGQKEREREMHRERERVRVSNHFGEGFLSFLRLFLAGGGVGGGLPQLHNLPDKKVAGRVTALLLNRAIATTTTSLLQLLLQACPFCSANMRMAWILFTSGP